MLLIGRDDFDRILRNSLTKEWDVLRDALVHFNYFKLWDEETVRECCILSKLEDYKPNEVNLNNSIIFTLKIPNLNRDMRKAILSEFNKKC